MSKWIVTLVLASVVGVGLAFFAGCESDAQTGALLGAGIGAGIGALAGGDTEGTLIGAAIGTGAGYLIGNEQDKKKTTEQINTVVVNVINSNGSVSPVTLKRQGVGYVGPRGEYYDHLPTSDELRPYGF